VGKNASTELAPVCAIMGGMVAAEVIKIISGKDAPINNLFLFDAATASGELRPLTPARDAPQPAPILASAPHSPPLLSLP
jgi:molybdopterin/thiamine biosynthesis adenylyltransferase